MLNVEPTEPHVPTQSDQFIYKIAKNDDYMVGLQVGTPGYVPPPPVVSFAPAPAGAGAGLDTRIDGDDNDLSDNIVPHTVQHTTVVRPASVNVQKIRPHTQV